MQHALGQGINMLQNIGKVGIKTYYKFFGVNMLTGKSRELSGWSGNVILTSGKNNLATRSTWFHACQLGTDSTTPAATQTGLLGYIDGTATIISEINGAQSSAPYYGWKRKIFRFDPGGAIANENLSEVGVGWNTAAGDTLVARALIEDITGVQTTITPLADEWLDVHVEMRYYPPLGDTTGTITLAGQVYDYTVRAANVTAQAYWANYIGTKITSYCESIGQWKAYDDDIGSIILSPSGLSYASDNTNDYQNSYVNNSYETVIGMSVGPYGWNATTNKLFRSFMFETTAGQYQVEFDDQSNPGFGIPKTTLYTLRLQFILGWTEATIP